MKKLYSLKSDDKSKKQAQVVKSDYIVIEQYESEYENAFANFTTLTLNHVVLSKMDILRLKPRQWLNDHIIDYYFSLLFANNSDFKFFFIYFSCIKRFTIGFELEKKIRIFLIIVKYLYRSFIIIIGFW